MSIYIYNICKMVLSIYEGALHPDRMVGRTPMLAMMLLVKRAGANIPTKWASMTDRDASNDRELWPIATC